jgi:hypothetical protein
MRALRWLDLVVLALALPVFLAVGMPLLGWAGVAGVWLAQRGAQHLVERRARASEDPTRATAALAISMFARVWIFALAIFILGKADRDAGLSAALLAVVLVTVYLTSLMTSGPLAPGSRR